MSKIKRLIKSYQTKVLTPTLKDTYSGGKHITKKRAAKKKQHNAKERSQK